jgi:hypothetical protein
MESELLHDRTSDDSIQTNSLMVQYDYGSVCHPYRRPAPGARTPHVHAPAGASSFAALYVVRTEG